MKDVSASKAALLAGCAFPFRDTTPTVDSRGRAAEMGDDFHQRIAPVVDTTLAIVDRPITTKWLRSRLEHAVEWVGRNAVPGWRAEVAYAYDPQAGKGRTLGYNIGRKYADHGALPHEICGSADIAWLTGDTVCVRDWKTGRTVGPAADAQLEWLGLFAARATGAWYADVAALHVTDYAVIEEGGRVLDDARLARIADELLSRVESIEDSWPETGAHCDGCYCPARAGCDLYQLTKKESAA